MMKVEDDRPKSEHYLRHLIDMDSRYLNNLYINLVSWTHYQNGHPKRLIHSQKNFNCMIMPRSWRSLAEFENEKKKQPASNVNNNSIKRWKSWWSNWKREKNNTYHRMMSLPQRMKGNQIVEITIIYLF